MRVDPEKVDRALVIGLSCLGDMLLASGALWNLRLFLPGAHFKIMVGPRAVEAVRHDPMWQEVEVYHRQRDYPGPWGRLKVISRIRAFRPDLIVDLRSGLNPLFSGARYAPLWGLKELSFPRRFTRRSGTSSAWPPSGFRSGPGTCAFTSPRRRRRRRSVWWGRGGSWC